MQTAPVKFKGKGAGALLTTAGRDDKIERGASPASEATIFVAESLNGLQLKVIPHTQSNKIIVFYF